MALDPDFFDVCERLFDRPAQVAALTVKDRALVEMALAALVTEIDSRALEGAARSAAAARATEAEVVAVLEIVSVVGLHSCSVGIPVLVEELRRRGEWDGSALTGRTAEVARRFESSGPRPRPIAGMYEEILRLDCDYFELFTDFIDVPWRNPALDPRLGQLVCIAIDTACTHLYVDGLHRHVREALHLGVSREEILEVIQLASVTGLKTLDVALPIVRAVFRDGER